MVTFSHPAKEMELLLYEPVAPMTVVVNAVFFLQFLNKVEGGLCVRPHAVIRVQQHLFETTVHAHAFVFCQVLQQAGQALLQPHGYVHALDFDWRPGVEQVMPK